MRLADGTGLGQAHEIVSALNKAPGVEFASMDYADSMAVTAGALDDPSNLQTQQDWRGLESQTGGTGIDWAWGYHGRGEGVEVIDVENSYNPDHVDLISLGISDFTDGVITGDTDNNFNHGTSSLGVLAADDDCDGVVGAAPYADDIGFVSAIGNGTTQTIINCPVGTPLQNNVSGAAKAIVIATQELGAGDVLLLELGRDVFGMDDINNADIPIETRPLVFCATKLATDAGIVLVTAAGNGNVDLDLTSSPEPGLADILQDWRDNGDSGAILVGAGSSDRVHEKLSFSSFGSRVDVQAWGRNVFTSGRGSGETTDLNTSYRQYSGTSSASAVVAGVAASVQSVRLEHLGSNQSLDSVGMRDLLNSTGLPQGNIIDNPGDIGPAVDAKGAIEDFRDAAKAQEISSGILPLTYDFEVPNNIEALDHWEEVTSLRGGDVVIPNALLLVNQIPGNQPDREVTTAADWHIVLTDEFQNLVLSFTHEVGDDPTFSGIEINEYRGMAATDGVFISQDGANWYRLLVPGMEEQTPADGDVKYDVSITAAIVQHELELEKPLRIRFQHHGGRGTGGTIGGRFFDEVTLRDEDLGTFAMFSSSIDVVESGPVLTIPVGRRNAPNSPATVDYRIVFRTASRGDFGGGVSFPMTGRIAFDPKEETGQIDLPLNTLGALPEHTETLRVILENPSGGASLDPDATETFVRLIDNDFEGPNQFHRVRTGRFVIPQVSSPPGQATGPAPILLNVGSVTGEVTKVTAKISDFNHAGYFLIDMILEGPDGTLVKLMSDVNFTGGAAVAEQINLTFDDDSAPIPENSLLSSGSYAGTDILFGQDRLLDGTVVNASTLLSAFNGKDPNGTWKLHIVESGSFDTPTPTGGGVLEGGYELVIETTDVPLPVFLSIRVSRGEDINYTYAGPEDQSFDVEGSTDLVNWTRFDIVTTTGFDNPESGFTIAPVFATKYYLRFRRQ